MADFLVKFQLYSETCQNTTDFSRHAVSPLTCGGHPVRRVQAVRTAAKSQETAGFSRLAGDLTFPPDVAAIRYIGCGFLGAASTPRASGWEMLPCGTATAQHRQRGGAATQTIRQSSSHRPRRRTALEVQSGSINQAQPICVANLERIQIVVGLHSRGKVGLPD